MLDMFADDYADAAKNTCLVNCSNGPLGNARRVALALWLGTSKTFTYQCMSNSPDNGTPWGTKGRLNRAGKKIRAGQDLSYEEADALDAWRGAHGYVLNTFKPLLWRRVAGKEIVVAQRLKRRSTIIDKLFREPTMELARMDDIAGSRLIFKDIRSLEAFRETFHKSKFNHRLRHEVERYNYILHPKPSGYRGVHEIYVYNVTSENGRKYNGLYIELQFRTVYQHAWATAVEVVGRVTENQPKFNQGDDSAIPSFF